MKDKNNKTNKITIFSKPLINVKKLTKEDLENIKKRYLGIELYNFRRKLYKKFESKNLKLLNFNIKTLKIKKKLFYPHMLFFNCVGGKYLYKTNEIKIISFLKNDCLTHELFHMASSIYDPYNDIAFCGFEQINLKEKLKVGIGLNEGYTELLTERYFKNSNRFSTDYYDACKFFSHMLEKIVGRKNMETFYITADLFGLMNFLSKYDEMQNIINFISALDCIVKNNNINKKYCEMCESYLIRWFSKMQKVKLDNKEISLDEYENNIKNYRDLFYYNDLNYKKLEKKYCFK